MRDLFRWFTVTSFLLVGISASVSGQTLKPSIEDDRERTVSGSSALDDAGSTVFVVADTDDFGANSRRAWQVVSFDALTAADSGVTSFYDGVFAGSVDVSDDGQWLVFLSHSDPLGTNHDESVELFVMTTNGTNLVQLTSTGGIDADPVGDFAFSGDGNRIAYASSGKVFIIDRDGTNLSEVAAATADRLTISDDASRIAFRSTDDPVGSNADFSREIFAVLADGTGLRQITSTVSGTSSAEDVQLSGDGSRLVWIGSDDPLSMNPSGFDQLFTELWSGSGLAQLTPGTGNASGPSMEDDGNRIVFASSMDESQNPEKNFEIWSVNADGSGLTALTVTAAEFSSDNARISGAGGRIVFYTRGGEFPGGDNTDFGPEWMSMDGAGGNLIQLTSLAPASTIVAPLAPQLTPDGTRIVYYNDHDSIWVANLDGTNKTKLTPEMLGVDSLSANDDTVVFHSFSDPLGTNPGPSQVLFAVELDGTGLRQLTPDIGGGDTHPSIAENGSWIVFQSLAALNGLRRVRPDGSDAANVVIDGDGLYKWPKISSNGQWVTYHSAAPGTNEIFRHAVVGGAPVQISVGGGYDPDISADGSRIVWDYGDCYLWDQVGGVSVLTTGSGCSAARITNDGAVVYYESAPELFDGVGSPYLRAYRHEITSGVVERIAGISARTADLIRARGLRNRHAEISFSADGRRILYFGTGDWDGDHPAGGWQVMIADLDEPNPIQISAAAPTIVSWIAEPKSRRYDVIRGDLASLQESGGVVDLGAVVCVEDDSVDPDTVGNEDPDVPLPGQGYFFLYRGTQGLSDGPGTYDRGSSGLERTATVGDCIE